MGSLPEIIVPPTSLRIDCGPIELRLPTPRNAQQQLSLTRDPAVTRYLNWNQSDTIDAALSYITDTRSLWSRGISYLPSIFLAEGDRLIGATGISGIDRINRRGEVGTWLGIEHQGAGHNLHAKAAVCALGFAVLDLTRLEFVIRVDNARSVASMRHIPCVIDEGVQSDRILDHTGAAHDAWMFAITRSSYDADAFPAVEIHGLHR